jgi:anti-sigma regulatory factor (Ser/Thr protein kinase)
VEVSGSRATVVNAGLPPILVLRKGEIVTSVAGGGAPLGMFDDSTYDEVRLDLKPGDRIVLLSDGLTEPWGKIDNSKAAIERLKLSPLDRATLPTPEELRFMLLGHVGDERMDDDRTVVVIEIPGPKRAAFAVRPNLSAIGDAVQFAIREAPTWVDPAALDHGLTEALTNALIHGVFGLSSEGRNEDEYDKYLELAEALSANETSTETGVEVSLERDAAMLGIHLRWTGSPCPIDARSPTPTPSSDDKVVSSGMGNRIIYSLFDEVSWDEDGFGLRLTFLRPTNDNAANLFALPGSNRL